MIADAAVWQALKRGRGAVYTSPLRALANQRFAQLEARWGDEGGVVTGEMVVRAAAPVRRMVLLSSITMMVRAVACGVVVIGSTRFPYDSTGDS